MFSYDPRIFFDLILIKIVNPWDLLVSSTHKCDILKDINYFWKMSKVNFNNNQNLISSRENQCIPD